MPFLYWITVVDAKNVSGLAELGVVFLLFLIGLELSYQRLLTMRRLVFGLGSLQVVLSTLVISGVAALVGNEPAASIIIGACLALSSTAIVIEVLSNQHRLSTAAGRTSFSVLLAQDLAVIPILLFISILGTARAARWSPVSCWRLPMPPWPRAHRHRRPSASPASLSPGCLHRIARTVRGGDLVRDCRHRPWQLALPGCPWRLERS